ncbi:MAG TPA: hypothetical protein VGN20_29010 [Mucilaginibacter sp.]|jgi:hypothetical protein
MRKYIRVIILIISLLTILSGIVQLVMPAFVLSQVGAAINDTTKQLFATIAMFMIMFGGLVVHALYDAQSNRAAFLWGAFQKFGASIAVGIGILHGIFNLTSGAVASFDFCSGILFLYYYKQIKADETY